MAVLSQRAFAKLAGVSHQAVGRAVLEGRLIADDGKLDPAHPTNAAFITAHQADNGANGTEAQIAALEVRAQWQRERLARVTAAHVEKASIAEGIKLTLAMLCDAAPLIPQRYHRVVAARLGIGEATARALLQDVANLLLLETTELPEAGHAAATRLT